VERLRQANEMANKQIKDLETQLSEANAKRLMIEQKMEGYQKQGHVRQLIILDVELI